MDADGVSIISDCTTVVTEQTFVFFNTIIIIE